MTAKVSNIQIASLFIMTRLFSECFNFPTAIAKYGMQHFTVIFISNIILFVIYIPLLIFSLKCPGKNIFSLFHERCKPLVYIIGIPFIINALYHVMLIGVQLDFFTTNTLMKTVPTYVIVFMFTIVIMYGAAKGLQAVARVSPIIMVLFLFALVAAVFCLSENIKFFYLYPVLVDDYSTLWGDVWQNVAKNSELFALIVLCSHTNKKSDGIIAVYLPSVFLLTEIMTLLCVTVLGPSLDTSGFPYNRLATLVNITVLERFDGVDLFIWTTAAILKMTIMMVVIRDVLGFMVRERIAKVITLIMTVIAGFGCYFLSMQHHILMIIDISAFTLSAMGVFGVICPVIGIFLGRSKTNGKKTGGEKSRSNGGNAELSVS